MAFRTHFKVLSLGLEASSPRKSPCPRLETGLFFNQLKFCWKKPETLRKFMLGRPFLFYSFGDRLKKFFEDLFFLRTIALVFRPSPRNGLSSERLFLALSVVSSTSPLATIDKIMTTKRYVFCSFFKHFCLQLQQYTVRVQQTNNDQVDGQTCHPMYNL